MTIVSVTKKTTAEMPRNVQWTAEWEEAEAEPFWGPGHSKQGEDQENWGMAPAQAGNL